jgi:hypothetical protein
MQFCIPIRCCIRVDERPFRDADASYSKTYKECPERGDELESPFKISPGSVGMARDVAYSDKSVHVFLSISTSANRALSRRQSGLARNLQV